MNIQQWVRQIAASFHLALGAMMGLLVAGCAIHLQQPVQNSTVAGPTRVEVRGNATYTGLRVDVDGRDFTADMLASGSTGHDGDLAVLAGSHQLTASAEVYCWYCSGSVTHSVASADFTVVNNLFTNVSAGGAHTCAIDTMKRMFCWGDNLHGQLGSGAISDMACPTATQPSARCQPNGVAVSGGLTWTQVSAGLTHSCGLTTLGGVFCWGSNEWGQLGNGSVTESRVPLPVTVSASVTLPFGSVSVGGRHSCALDAAMRLFCWGDNRQFQLGVAGLGACPVGSADACSTTPIQQGSYPGGNSYFFVDVSAGETHTCASNGQAIKCWGGNTEGQLGQGTHGAGSGGPNGNPGVPGNYLVGVSAGGGHTCAVRAVAAGTGADCWGDNHMGQLGGGWPDMNLDTPHPVARPGGAGGSVSGVSTGGQHTCALFLSAMPNSVRVPACAGLNNQGQLGQGPLAVDVQPHATLVSVLLSSANAGSDFFKVSAGSSHTCALKLVTTTGNTLAAGAVLCWGNNSFGQVGQNYQALWDSPTVVHGL